MLSGQVTLTPADGDWPCSKHKHYLRGPRLGQALPRHPGGALPGPLAVPCSEKEVCVCVCRGPGHTVLGAPGGPPHHCGSAVTPTPPHFTLVFYVLMCFLFFNYISGKSVFSPLSCQACYFFVFVF